MRYWFFTYNNIHNNTSRTSRHRRRLVIKQVYILLRTYIIIYAQRARVLLRLRLAGNDFLLSLLNLSSRQTYWFFSFVVIQKGYNIRGRVHFTNDRFYSEMYTNKRRIRSGFRLQQQRNDTQKHLIQFYYNKYTQDVQIINIQTKTSLRETNRIELLSDKNEHRSNSYVRYFSIRVKVVGIYIYIRSQQLTLKWSSKFRRLSTSYIVLLLNIQGIRHRLIHDIRSTIRP